MVYKDVVRYVCMPNKLYVDSWDNMTSMLS